METYIAFLNAISHNEHDRDPPTRVAEYCFPGLFFMYVSYFADYGGLGIWVLGFWA